MGARYFHFTEEFLFRRGREVVYEYFQRTRHIQPRRAIRLTTVERRNLQPLDVLIEILYAGIFPFRHSSRSRRVGPVQYPLVPGREIAGIVTQVDRYGQYTQGGYSTHIVVTEGFVVRIPDRIGLDVAAPLLCAGITTYSPLRHWGVTLGKKVAVVGLGGLGHMAVKLAPAMGAEVTVPSLSLKKKEDGLRLGAGHDYATSDPETFAGLAGSFDLIVNTASAKVDVSAYLSLLTVDDALVNVGAFPEPLSLNVFPLIGRRRPFAGSMVGGICETQEMLDFCMEHHIALEIELISAAQIDEAWQRVLAADVRYRFVIDISTMGNE